MWKPLIMFVVRRYGPIVAQKAVESRFAQKFMYNLHMFMLRQASKFDEISTKTKADFTAAASSTSSQPSNALPNTLPSNPYLRRVTQWYQTRRYERMLKERAKLEAKRGSKDGT